MDTWKERRVLDCKIKIEEELSTEFKIVSENFFGKEIDDKAVKK
jgi:hypothetical protein